MNYNINTAVNPLNLKQLKDNRGSFLALGIGLVILGTLAIIYAFASTIFSVIFLGTLLLFFGLFEGVKSFKISLWSNFFLHIFLSILYIVTGVFILLNPTVNAVSLTLLLAIFFVVSGIAKVVISILKEVPHKGWLIANGILSVILGILIWKQWPVSGLWVIGLLVGIEAIFTGWTWILLSIAAKNLTTQELNKQ
jgi:uncharacterized membrane protein HdeD (DUF308 family)